MLIDSFVFVSYLCGHSLNGTCNVFLHAIFYSKLMAEQLIFCHDGERETRRQPQNFFLLHRWEKVHVSSLYCFLWRGAKFWKTQINLCLISTSTLLLLNFICLIQSLNEYHFLQLIFEAKIISAKIIAKFIETKNYRKNYQSKNYRKK